MERGGPGPHEVTDASVCLPARPVLNHALGPCRGPTHGRGRRRCHGRGHALRGGAERPPCCGHPGAVDHGAVMAARSRHRRCYRRLRQNRRSHQTSLAAPILRRPRAPPRSLNQIPPRHPYAAPCASGASQEGLLPADRRVGGAFQAPGCLPVRRRCSRNTRQHQIAGSPFRTETRGNQHVRQAHGLCNQQRAGNRLSPPVAIVHPFAQLCRVRQPQLQLLPCTVQQHACILLDWRLRPESTEAR